MCRDCRCGKLSQRAVIKWKAARGRTKSEPPPDLVLWPAQAHHIHKESITRDFPARLDMPRFYSVGSMLVPVGSHNLLSE